MSPERRSLAPHFLVRPASVGLVRTSVLALALAALLPGASASGAAAPPARPAVATPSATTWITVMRDGTRVVSQVRPVFVFGSASTRRVDGTWVTLKAIDVDDAATAAANPLAGPPVPRVPGKVFTSADLERLSDGRPLGPSEEPMPAGAEAEGTAPKPGPTEAAWRAWATQLDDKLRYQQALAAGYRRVEEQWSAYALGVPEHSAAAGHQIAEARRKADVAEEAIRQAQGERENLEEDARRAGVPPGWLR